jgi:hypothetical protein
MVRPAMPVMECSAHQGPHAPCHVGPHPDTAPPWSCPVLLHDCIGPLNQLTLQPARDMHCVGWTISDCKGCGEPSVGFVYHIVHANVYSCVPHILSCWEQSLADPLQDLRDLRTPAAPGSATDLAVGLPPLDRNCLVCPVVGRFVPLWHPIAVAWAEAARDGFPRDTACRPVVAVHQCVPQ